MMYQMNLDGIILINKPKGWTSFDVVAKVRNILKKEAGRKIKVGHSGTLDPLATGLLVILVGKYTKRANEFSKFDKTYEVEMTLGKISSTGDLEGKLTEISTKIPSETHIEDVITNFIGTYEQIPPAYSAVKINGKRAYKLARAGKEVNIEPRKITIYSVKDIEYTYPVVRFITRVSSGTYIRSLAQDIGEKLGTGAYMSDLTRTEIGPFKLADANSIDQASIDKIIQI